MYDLSSGVLFLLCKNGLHHIEINFLPMKAKKYFEYIVMQKKSNILSQSPPFFMKRQKWITLTKAGLLDEGHSF